MNVIPIMAAVIPALILLVQVYRADRLEKEPTKLLLTLVICGIAATELSYLAERAGVWALDQVVPVESIAYDLLLFFVVVAIAEEGFKYLLLQAETWRSPHFNCSFDGVVYAVFVSLGFAIWENIQYVMEYGLTVAAARAVTAIPGHACFGVFMGTWYGAAKRCQRAGKKGRALAARFMAFLLPTLIHGAYDSLAITQDESVTWAFLAFVGLMFIISLGLLKSLSAHDVYLARKKTEEHGQGNP